MSRRGKRPGKRAVARHGKGRAGSRFPHPVLVSAIPEEGTSHPMIRRAEDAWLRSGPILISPNNPVAHDSRRRAGRPSGLTWGGAIEVFTSSLDAMQHWERWETGLLPN